MDPLSILLAANTCVAAIKQGCQLYKDAKTSFMEIKKTVDDVASDAFDALETIMLVPLAEETYTACPLEIASPSFT